MNIQEFKETYCDNCGFSPCEGPHTEHFIDCRFKNKMSTYDVYLADNPLVSKEDVISAWERIYEVLLKNGVNINGTIECVNLNKVYAAYGYNHVDTIYSISLDFAFSDNIDSNAIIMISDDNYNTFTFKITFYNENENHFYYYNSSIDYFAEFMEDSYLNHIL